MKPSGGRYNRTAEQKKAVDDAFAEYVPGGYRASTEMPKRKKKPAAKKKAKTLRAGQAQSPNVKQAYKDIKAGNYD